MPQKTSESSTSRPCRKAKPSIEWLVDGQKRYLQLHDALENATTEETVAIIPPYGSDTEEANEEDTRDNFIEDVAGLLEVVPIEKHDDGSSCTPLNWKIHHNPNPIPQGPRIPTVSESHPLLSSLSLPTLLHQRMF